MKWRSSYLTELQKSMRPGAKAELVTARKMFGGRKSIGLGTIAAYRMDPKQRMQRLHYAMACAKWGTLSDAQKNAYSAWAEVNKITLFSAFLHYYLAELKEDLVLYLPMDKITGSTVKDYSKYANDGTETNTTLQKDEFIGNSLDFNGTSSNINCGHDPSLNPTVTQSIMCWAKPIGLPAGPSSHRLTFKDWNAMTIYIPSTSSTLKCYQAMSGGNFASGTITVEENVWTHAAMTCTDGDQNFYVNGERKSHGTVAGTLLNNSAYNINLGSSSGGGSEQFEGCLDETRIYKKMLTAEEILAIYRQESKWHGDVA